jgi:predicted RNase H-like nuclease (RuvC/YqgF family)
MKEECKTTVNLPVEDYLSLKKAYEHYENNHVLVKGTTLPYMIHYFDDETYFRFQSPTEMEEQLNEQYAKLIEKGNRYIPKNIREYEKMAREVRDLDDKNYALNKQVEMLKYKLKERSFWTKLFGS